MEKGSGDSQTSLLEQLDLVQRELLGVQDALAKRLHSEGALALFSSLEALSRSMKPRNILDMRERSIQELLKSADKKGNALTRFLTSKNFECAIPPILTSLVPPPPLISSLHFF